MVVLRGQFKDSCEGQEVQETAYICSHPPSNCMQYTTHSLSYVIPSASALTKHAHPPLFYVVEEIIWSNLVPLEPTRTELCVCASVCGLAERHVIFGYICCSRHGRS